MRLRRIIPRFSLRTLVVFMLLVTSGVGLWWRRAPWTRMGMLDCGNSLDPVLAEFSGDGERILVLAIDTATTSGDVITLVHDAKTGDRIAVRDEPDDSDWWHRRVMPLFQRRYFPSPDGSRIATEYVMEYHGGLPGQHVGAAVLDASSKEVLAVFAGLFVWSVVRDRRALA